MSKKSLFLRFVGALGILTLGACIGTSTDVPNHSTNAGLSSQVASSSAANANFDSRAYGDGILSDVRMLDPEPITGVFS
jgi:hypothetical protein